ncbi:multidrug DMT transporter permease [Lewinella sp. 4G2]|uniref:multidrug DMT transporter permease n=1 Tax=Lewinella sp. 4G2 TaxID=1803372 RepID=UPI0007B4AAB5|nr:multidrug DMT transporter permease [Lewinella sp. 4G2]OAV43582.1 multidrug DMT transporter permease [Lewinella sp. 4G2]
MFIPASYGLAVVLCIVTMFCWGSWANTQKLASRSWAFPLFYWDYVIGIVLLTLLFGFTLGSVGEEGRSFVEDLQQGSGSAFGSAFLGGVIFNLANLLIVAAIAVSGMAVAFPVGIGIALVLGVIVNYVANPLGDPLLLFLGVGLVTVAIIVDALIYKRLPGEGASSTTKGLSLAVAGGVLMGFFFRFVAAATATDFVNPAAGLLTPYSAVFVFSLGILASNFVWNTYFMYRPVEGAAVSYADYFKLGTPKLHFIGILGGLIWGTGMSLSLIASEKAGFAISYGLGQGATMVAAAWGVFIWKEFKTAPAGTNKLIGFMFGLFVLGLVLIVGARGV